MCLIVVLVAVTSGASLADARLVHEGTLAGPEQPLGPVTSLASSENTVVAAYPDALNLYSEPAAGWASATPTATLQGPAGVQGPYAVAISGGTVVASYEAESRPWFDEVFVEPSGGWSGSVTPAAKLAAPEGWDLTSPVISGDTIVAGATDPHGSAAGGYFVYTKPAGGWSGTLLPSASLRDSSGLQLYGSVAILGETIFIGAERVVGPDNLVTVDRGDAFTEPTGGWSGTVQQSAKLVGPPGSYFGITSASGHVVASYASLFNEPRAGWRGEIRASAELLPGADTLSALFAATYSLPLGPQHECPCTGQVSLYTLPKDGWRGAIDAAPALGVTSTTGALEIALQDSTLFVADDYAIQLYRVEGSYGTRAPGPQVASPYLARDRGPRLALSFSIHVNATSAAIRQLTLELPKGLRFARSPRTLKHVSVSGVEVEKEIKASRLMLQLERPESHVSVTIGDGGLRESGSLVRLVERSERSGIHKLLLHGTLVATDEDGVSWPLPVRFRLR